MADSSEASRQKSSYWSAVVVQIERRLVQGVDQLHGLLDRIDRQIERVSHLIDECPRRMSKCIADTTAVLSRSPTLQFGTRDVISPVAAASSNATDQCESDDDGQDDAVPSLADFCELQEAIRSVQPYSINELKQRISAFPNRYLPDLFCSLTEIDFVMNPSLGELLCDSPVSGLTVYAGCCPQWAASLGEVETARSLLPLGLIDGTESRLFDKSADGAHPVVSTNVARLLLEISNELSVDGWTCHAELALCGAAPRIIRRLNDAELIGVNDCSSLSRSVFVWFLEGQSAAEPEEFQWFPYAIIPKRRAVFPLLFPSAALFGDDGEVVLGWVARWPYLFRYYVQAFPERMSRSVLEFPPYAVDPFVIRTPFQMLPDPSEWQLANSTVGKANLKTLQTWKKLGILVENPQVLVDACSYGCARGHEGMEEIQFLVNSGMDVNFADVKGCTALREAVESGRLDIVNLLIDADANVDLGPDGKTDVHRARDLAVALALLEAGVEADVAEPDRLKGLRSLLERRWKRSRV